MHSIWVKVIITNLKEFSVEVHQSVLADRIVMHLAMQDKLLKLVAQQNSTRYRRSSLRSQLTFNSKAK